MKKIILLSVLSIFVVSCSSKKKKNKTAENNVEQSASAPTESNLPTTDTSQYIQTVKSKVRAKGKEISGCYTDAMKKSDANAENLIGKIYFAWTIIATGEIKKLRVNREKSTIEDKGLESCMQEIISNIEFDSLVGKDYLHINYPFKFTGKKPLE